MSQSEFKSKLRFLPTMDFASLYPSSIKVHLFPNKFLLRKVKIKHILNSI